MALNKPTLVINNFSTVSGTAVVTTAFTNDTFSSVTYNANVVNQNAKLNTLLTSVAALITYIDNA